MRKIILIILIVSLNSCESVKNALTGKKYESSDEFLIIKKKSISSSSRIQQITHP